MDKKARHEQFVTGFAGGSVVETYAVSAICVLSMIVQHYVSQVLQDGLARYVSDFIFNWVLVLASVTYYANNLLLLAVILLLTLAAAIYSLREGRGETNKQKMKEKVKPARGKQHNEAVHKSEVTKFSGSPSVDTSSATGAVYRPFITCYRSAMMVLTMTAILAVDFTAFPRRFAKTETWGTSLMDLGVGSFVFSLGIVSARKELKTGKPLAFSEEVAISIKQTLKVLALGVVRLISVKSLDYQEHVSEYGVHWNFFFTLGFLPVSFVFVRRFPLKLLNYTIRGILIALLHELALKNTGLMEWALIAPRVTLLSQNKEGIVSFVGYLAIFTFGYSLGLSILSAKSSFRQIVTQLGKWAVIAQVSLYILRIATEPSRRLANLPYISWVVAFNSGFIALLALAEEYIHVKPSPSYVAVNKFGETMFVLANLGTGVINMSLDTVALQKPGTVMALVCYQLALLVISLLQYKYRS